VLLSAFVKDDKQTSGREGARKQFCLGGHAAALPILDFLFVKGAKAQRACHSVEAPDIVIHQRALRSGPQPTDRA
jgi:hypothetical protein